jgi:uncharacterized protein YyaL (SSP411 family)
VPTGRLLPPGFLLCLTVAAAGAGSAAGAGRLERESSPYLREHAQDPVDWRPWGSEALDDARRERRLVFLSVGEWASVRGRSLEGEMLGAPETVAVLRRTVPVKLDRDERPDVARVYEAAALLAAESPLEPGPFVAVLTPDGRPLRGLSLSRGGRPAAGLAALLARLVNEYEASHDDIETRAGLALASLREAQRPEPPRGPLGRDVVDRALKGLSESFDARHGGFGLAPKALPHASLRLLLQEAAGGGSAPALRMATVTLDALARSPLRDPAAGGFFRGCADEGWQRPEPEKRLVDNALLLRAYAAAHDLTGRSDYRDVAEMLVRFLTSGLADPAGGFRAGTRTQGGATETDERVFAGANGLAIGALASAGTQLQRPSDVDAARSAAVRVLERLGPPDRLKRHALADVGRGEPALEDYAYLAEGLLDLYEATHEPRWRTESVALVDAASVRFLDPRQDGFFDNGATDPLVPARLRDGYDAVLPGPNGVMAAVLLRLAAATGETRYAELGRRTVLAFLGDLQRAPRGIETLAATASLFLGRPTAAAAAEAPWPAREVRGPVTIEAALSALLARPGQDLEARVRLTIAAGWRVNAHVPGPKDLVALTVAVPGASFVAGAPRYPRGRPFSQPFSTQAAAGLEGEATIAVPLRIPAGAASGEQRVRLRVGFQACDARDCRGPESVLLETPLTIARP